MSLDRQNNFHLSGKEARTLPEILIDWVSFLVSVSLPYMQFSLCISVCLIGRGSAVCWLLAAGWMVHVLNPGEVEIFRIRSLLYDGHQVALPGVMWPGRSVHNPPSPSAEVKESVDLYLYSPSGPSCNVRG